MTNPPKRSGSPWDHKPTVFLFWLSVALMFGLCAVAGSGWKP